MRLAERLRSIEVTPRTTAICVCLVILAGTAVVVTAKNMAGSTPDKPRHSVKATAPKSRVDIEERKAEKPDTKKDKAGKEETKPVTVAKDDPYAVIVERNLFKPIGAGASSAKPQAGPPKPEAPKMPSNVPPLPPMPKSGGDTSEARKNLAYTGMVELPDGPQALIENISSKETAWKKVGESAFGCRVVSISERSVSLDKDGSEFRLSIGENKPDTDPGAKGGGPPSGSGGPGGSGQQGQPGGPPGSEGRK